jgi:hypothetical protein
VSDYELLVAMFLTMGVDMDRGKVKEVCTKLFGTDPTQEPSIDVIKYA